MIRKITVLLSLLVACFVFATLFRLNSASVMVVPWPGVKWNLMLAEVIIGFFFLGVVVTGIIGLGFEANSSFRNWRFTRKRRLEEKHQQQIIEAREQLCAHNFQAAEKLFRQIISRDSSNIVARILLAKTLHAQGQFEKALSTLEEARASQRTNLELLLLAAQLNESRGNLTAACDNLSLVIKADPGNLYALKQLVRISVMLERFDDGLKYQRLLVNNSPSDAQSKERDSLADIAFQSLLKTLENTSDAEKKDLVKQHNKDFRDHAPSLDLLARMERDEGLEDAAIKLWSQAFLCSANTSYLWSIATYLSKQNNPDKALGIVKKLRKEFVDDSQVLFDIDLFLVHLYLSLEMVDNAKGLLSDLISAESGSKHKRILEITRAEILKRTGNSEEALELVMPLLKESSNSLALSCSLSKSAQGEKRSTGLLLPDPELSTP